jgi:hypothetical protein
VASLFGTFIDFDEDTVTRNRMDVANLLISTKRLGKIDEVLKVKVMGAVSSIWVVEGVTMFEEGEGSREEGSEVSKDRRGLWEEDDVEGRPEMEVGEEDSISGEEEGFEEEEDGTVPPVNLGPVGDKLSPRPNIDGVSQKGRCEVTFLASQENRKDLCDRESDVPKGSGQVSQLGEEALLKEDRGACDEMAVGVGGQSLPCGALGKVGGETHQSVSLHETGERVKEVLEATCDVEQVNLVGPGKDLMCGECVGPGGVFVGPIDGSGPLTQEEELDSEETISDSRIHQQNLNHGRGRKKNSKKHRVVALGTSKCFQFAKAIKEGKGGVRRKGSLGEGSSKHVEQPLVRGEKAAEEVLGAFNVAEEGAGGGPGSSASGLRLILEESGTREPTTPLIALTSTCRKDLDASRIFSLQKTNGINFEVVDKSMVSKLAELGDIEVAKEDTRGKELVSQ